MIIAFAGTTEMIFPKIQYTKSDIIILTLSIKIDPKNTDNINANK